MGELLRTCSRCSVEKPILSFIKDNRRESGHGYACRECEGKRYKDRSYRPEVRKKKVEIEARRCIDPIKLSARRKVKDAVRRGKIIKPSVCADCNEASDLIHGHHEDYSKPLDVVWLCAPCHVKRHNTPAPAQEGDE